MVDRVNNQVKMYRKLAIEHLGGKCAECGSTNHLEIHHKNKDWKRNDLENLILLCLTCHRKTHHAVRDKLGRVKAHLRLRTIKGNQYLYLYTSERVGGTPKSKYLAYLGRVGLNAIRRLPKEYRSSGLTEKIRELEFDARLDEIFKDRHGTLVRLG